MKISVSSAEKEERKRCVQIRSLLRRAWSRDPRRYETLSAAKRKYKGANKRQQYEYQCAVCKKWWKGTEVQVDHVEPAGSFLYMSQIGEFTYKLFCGSLQVLDKSCHNKKTQEERKKRATDK